MSLAETKEFHEAFDHPVAEKRNLITKDRFRLRSMLIREELDETLRDYVAGDLVKTADGLADLDVVINGALLEFGFTEIHPDGEEYYTFEQRDTPKLLSYREIVHIYYKIDVTLSELADAYLTEEDVNKAIDSLIYMKYLVSFMAANLGIPQEEICTAVHKANMSKLDEDGKPIYRSDGKILKGPNFRPPEEDIEAILREHGAEL